MSGCDFQEFNPREIEVPQIGSLPHYELLCHSRHLGFPSPLLDWTQSLYVALFFAYKLAKKDANPAIFILEPAESSIWGSSEAVINIVGPYVKTHKRHYSQQSQYTTCTQEVNGENLFVNHEKALAHTPENQKIHKFTLKSQEKEAALLRLYRMNINNYTLFSNEESLMETLAYKEFRNL